METNLTEDFFDTVGKKYEEVYGTSQSLVSFVQGTLQLLPTNASVLDVGSGTGKPVAELLTSGGLKVLGIDRSQVMVDIAKKQVPSADFERADMLIWEPKHGLFQAIYAIFVFFALSREQAEGMLAKFAKWVEPRGYLFIASLPAEDYVKDKTKFDAEGLYATNVGNDFMGQIVDISMMTREGWRVFLDKAGFELVSHETILFTPDPKQEVIEKHLFITARRRN